VLEVVLLRLLLLLVVLVLVLVGARSLSKRMLLPLGALLTVDDLRCDRRRRRHARRAGGARNPVREDAVLAVLALAEREEAARDVARDFSRGQVGRRRRRGRLGSGRRSSVVHARAILCNE
jgi:hypothetical protein